VCYARGFGEPLKIYHGLSFFFLERLSSFFPERKEERCGIIYKKNNSRKIKKFTQIKILTV